jgi:hypothetical protein
MDVPNILNYLISSTYMTLYVPNKLKFELKLRKRYGFSICQNLFSKIDCNVT